MGWANTAKGPEPPRAWRGERWVYFGTGNANFRTRLEWKVSVFVIGAALWPGNPPFWYLKGKMCTHPCLLAPGRALGSSSMSVLCIIMAHAARRCAASALLAKRNSPDISSYSPCAPMRSRQLDAIESCNTFNDWHRGHELKSSGHPKTTGSL